MGIMKVKIILRKLRTHSRERDEVHAEFTEVTKQVLVNPSQSLV